MLSGVVSPQLNPDVENIWISSSEMRPIFFLEPKKPFILWRHGHRPDPPFLSTPIFSNPRSSRRTPVPNLLSDFRNQARLSEKQLVESVPSHTS
jgi:hypothetical protein